MGGWSEKSCQLHVELPAKSALSPANNVGGVIIIRRLLSPRNGLGHSHGFGLGQWVVPMGGVGGLSWGADKMPLTFTNEARQRINEPRPISECVT